MAPMGIRRSINRAGYSSPYFWNLEGIMKRKQKIAAPAISAIALYNQQRAEEAQTAYGGKPLKNLTSRVKYLSNLESRFIS